MMIMFTAYLNKGKNKGKPSNVKDYRLGADYIDVRFFGNPVIYRYSYIKTGQAHVEEMKRLAIVGEGLNSYIVKNFRKPGLFEKIY